MPREVTDPAIPFADDPAQWRRYDGFVRRLAARLLGDDHAADDVAQQVWQQALDGGPRVSAAWTSWLQRVVQRLAARRARGDRRRRAHEASAEPMAAPPTPAEIRAREDT